LQSRGRNLESFSILRPRNNGRSTGRLERISDPQKGISMKRIARWESRRGKYWLGLYREETPSRFTWYVYKGDNSGGVLGSIPEADAIAYLEKLATISAPSKLFRVSF